MKSKDLATLTLDQTDEKAVETPYIEKMKPVNEYVELKQLIKKNGLLDKQPLYYIYKFTLTLGMLVASITFLFLVHIFWLQLLDAAFLAMVSTQIGFLGHDAGHRQIFHSTRKNNFVAMFLGNLLIGMSNNWWLDKHNRHHSHPNQVEMDPDIEIAVIALTAEEAQTKQSFQRFIVKYQAFFFFPLLSLVGLDLHYRSILFLFCNKVKYRNAEIGLLIAHYALYVGMLLFLFNAWQALLICVIHELLFGFFLGSAFAPNHKGMPILEKDSPMNFLRQQVLTSRNVHAGLFNDFWYGGLNYQIEHHLFPSMPRKNLKQAQHLVKAYCKTRSIAYVETSVIQSYREILGFLYRISATLRTSRT